MKMRRWKRRSYIFFLLFPSLSFANFHYRPEYAQSSSLAYAQALGYSSVILPYGSSSIMQSPSLLYQVGQPSFTGGYGNTQYSTHSLDLAYVSPVFGDDSSLMFGLEYLINFIPDGTKMDNNYFQGRSSGLGFEQVLTSAIAYDFGDVGTFGINIKFPFDSYQKGHVDGGMLLNASYDINFFGFTFMVGIANIGGMYEDRDFMGVYPDVQAGIGYNYLDSNGELVFDLGMSLENNLGELIGDSFVFAIGGRIRLVSTGFWKSKPLVRDDILKYRDNRDTDDYKTEGFFSSLSASLYLDLAFQFSGTPHFSIGLTSTINSYMLDLGIIFPSSKTKRFGAYVSFGKIL